MDAQLDRVSDLAECEAVIERGINTFVEVGTALMRIRDERLYRSQYVTFEAYCRERWGWSRSHAQEVIQSAEVVGLMSANADSPANEWQARQLTPLLDQPEVLRDVWAGVIERAERDQTPITGPVIRNAVRDRIRGEAAASEAELQEVTADWTPEQRSAVSPEMMRQRGELMRLIHDLNGLPRAEDLPREHYVALRRSDTFYGEAMWACVWLTTFCDILEEKQP